MCGIAGAVLGPGQPEDRLAATVGAMTDTLVHRGPDDGGTWVDPDAGVALGNRRLAVIDLSPDGHQPMASADGRYVVAFNGEVYNFAELRRRLESAGARFRGRSDTEVLVQAIAAWGLEATLGEVNGMFALAAWDRAERRLTLARDRFGEKPLYYARIGSGLIFGSELRALLAYPGFRPAIDRDAVALYLRYGCIPAPRSVYEGVAKLSAGEILELQPGRQARTRPWWSARACAEAALADPLDLSPAEAADEVGRLLADSVALRSVADVALGAFLSGGVDSACVAALLAARSGGQSTRTFTIGFSEAAYDEAAGAAAVARHLGTDHTELYVGPTEAAAAIARLPGVYDEPFADSSQLPTLLVSELARRHVTVVLSGDGGDELFGGYNRHLSFQPLWQRIERLPIALRRSLAAGLRAGSPATWDRLAVAIAPVLPPRLRLRHPGQKAHKVAAVLEAPSSAAAYRALASTWAGPGTLVVGGLEPTTVADDPAAWRGLGDLTDQVMLLDTLTYLPDDQLTKLDRASMAVGLEARVPLLDHRLFALTWRLRRSLRLHPGSSKWVLREVLGRYVPPALVATVKSGFALPLREWLRGPLRPWAEDLLAERRLGDGDLLHPAPVRRAWDEHVSGHFDRSAQLWAVLMLEAWREEPR